MELETLWQKEEIVRSSLANLRLSQCFQMVSAADASPISKKRVKGKTLAWGLAWCMSAQNLGPLLIHYMHVHIG